ncbi:type VII secretion effector (TIGR04197 family) [Lachnospiraceae bacterium PF1-21]
MSDLKSDLSLTSESENRLKSKCIGIGTGNTIAAQESNIQGVTDNATIYKACLGALKSYKELLDADATHIHDLGVAFFDFDRSMSKKM